jgi:hypothetical protein
MRKASSSFLLTGAVVAALASFPACSGGGTAEADSVRIRCLDGAPFCLISCNLGCSQTGCSVTEISENERLRFKFSDRVDPNTVNGASIAIRTASGVAPDGEFLVSGSEVTFVPSVSTQGGVSTFGFLRDESYIITIAGGDSSAFGVKSFSGDALGQEFNCTVRATLGIQDENQQPPSASLVSPTVTTGVALEPTIVLQFSELIDTAALQVPLSSSSPIRVILRGTLPNGECDLDAEGIALEGLPQLTTTAVGDTDVTVVTFRPSVELPGNSCVSVYVTADIRDLSGRQATPSQYNLITTEATPQPIDIDELFLTDARQEPAVSGGTWNNGARPGVIGEDGRHGSFNPVFGTPLGAGVFEWNLDQVGGIVIPGGNTPSGQAFNVTDGRFFFTDFVLNEGQVLRFRGSVPPQIRVRGRIEIRGTIDLNGVDMPATVPTTGALAGQRVTTFNARGTNSVVTGQLGGVGGCGGGSGGNGANECNGLGPQIVSGVNLTNGQPGQTVRVLGSHAYAAQTGGTGGLGSALNPATGLTTTIAVGPYIAAGALSYHDEFSLGGGGGGYMLAGGVPATPSIPAPAVTQPNNGPATAGGVAFPLLPLPTTPPANYQSIDHFLVGGSGGGGGGSHSFGILTVLTDDFMAGHGGSGGGGAIALRAGGDLLVASTGQILVRGGRGVVINGDNPATSTADVDFGVSSPGGGGSGGSVLLQSGKNLTVQGLLDAGGGQGSRVSNVSVFSTAPFQISVQAQGGAGSNGFYRLEAGGTLNFNGPVGTVPAYDPATNAGTLTDRDDRSGDVSKWISTGRIFPPTWLRYELDVDPDGAGPLPTTTYTDTGEPGTFKANDPAGPVTIQFQGARIAQDGVTPIEGSVKAWRDGVGTGAGPGIQQDSVTGFRFQLLYNRLAFPDVVVTALRVRART